MVMTWIQHLQASHSHRIKSKSSHEKLALSLLKKFFRHSLLAEFLVVSLTKIAFICSGLNWKNGLGEWFLTFSALIVEGSLHQQGTDEQLLLGWQIIVYTGP